MSLEQLFVVIMAGGRGTRMWPLSLPEHPKQFLRLRSSRSLLQQTWDRVLEIVPGERIVRYLLRM
jgi:mannose-1-phosphate guanylyltransferase